MSKKDYYGSRNLSGLVEGIFHTIDVHTDDDTSHYLVNSQPIHTDQIVELPDSINKFWNNNQSHSINDTTDVHYLTEPPLNNEILVFDSTLDDGDGNIGAWYNTSNLYCSSITHTTTPNNISVNDNLNLTEKQILNCNQIDVDNITSTTNTEVNILKNFDMSENNILNCNQIDVDNITSGETEINILKNVNINSNDLYGLPNIPPSSSSAISKSYFDTQILKGALTKENCQVATTGSNITLSGEQTIDGVLTNSSRVLVKDQTDKTKNGIYISSVSGWVRSDDLDNAPSSEIYNAVWTHISEGTINTGFAFRIYSVGSGLDGLHIIDTDNILWELSSINFTVNAPLTKTGDLISLDHNTTNLKITSDQLNTIQDINTTATPSFTGVSLDNITSGGAKVNILKLLDVNNNNIKGCIQIDCDEITSLTNSFIQVSKDLDLGGTNKIKKCDRADIKTLENTGGTAITVVEDVDVSNNRILNVLSLDCDTITSSNTEINISKNLDLEENDILNTDLIDVDNITSNTNSKINILKDLDLGGNNLLNYSNGFVTLTDVQTLTNKTITSPTVDGTQLTITAPTVNHIADDALFIIDDNKVGAGSGFSSLRLAQSASSETCSMNCIRIGSPVWAPTAGVGDCVFTVSSNKNFLFHQSTGLKLTIGNITRFNTDIKLDNNSVNEVNQIEVDNITTPNTEINIKKNLDLENNQILNCNSLDVDNITSSNLVIEVAKHINLASGKSLLNATVVDTGTINSFSTSQIYVDNDLDLGNGRSLKNVVNLNGSAVSTYTRNTAIQTLQNKTINTNQNNFNINSQINFNNNDVINMTRLNTYLLTTYTRNDASQTLTAKTINAGTFTGQSEFNGDIDMNNNDILDCKTLNGVDPDLYLTESVLTFNITFSGPWSPTTYTRGVKFRKVGKIVNMTIPSINEVATTSSIIIGVTFLPLAYAPASTVRVPCIVYDNSVLVFGSALITPSQILVYVGPNTTGNFQASGSAGWAYELTFTYQTS